MLRFGRSKLYDQIYTDDALTEAWRKVKSGTAVAGVDEITVPMFEVRLFVNLKAVQDELRRRQYYPQPVKRFYLPKADGSKRPVGILTVRDRIVQRALLNVLDPVIDPHFEECNHGFRKGRSVQTALDQVGRLVQQEYAWLVDVDITAYFEHINTSRLFKILKAHLSDRELLRVLRAILDVETVVAERLGVWQSVTSRGILQGGVLSALFANLYLDQFDKQALQHGLKHVRYGDDLVICCRSKREAEATLKRVTKLLAKMGLEVNPRKTMIVHAEKGIHFLGERLFLKTTKRGKTRVVGSRLQPRPMRVVSAPPSLTAVEPELVDADETEIL